MIMCVYDEVNHFYGKEDESEPRPILFLTCPLFCNKNVSKY